MAVETFGVDAAFLLGFNSRFGGLVGAAGQAIDDDAVDAIIEAAAAEVNAALMAAFGSDAISVITTAGATSTPYVRAKMLVVHLASPLLLSSAVLVGEIPQAVTALEARAREQLAALGVQPAAWGFPTEGVGARTRFPLLYTDEDASEVQADSFTSRLRSPNRLSFL